MCLAQEPQHSDAGEARNRGPSLSSQALYHWATALLSIYINDIQLCFYEKAILRTQKKIY